MYRNLDIFLQLIKIDLIIFKKNYWNKIISTIIWVTCVLLVTNYVFPRMGMTGGYGAFVAITTISSSSFWNVWSKNADFAADLEGNKTIFYYLTLPFPSWLFFIKEAVSFAIQSMAISILILPLSKLILWNSLDLSNFSIIRFIAILILINLFYGFFAIFTSSFAKNIKNIDTIWTRILFPLWFFGGTQFSWYTMYKFFPKFAIFTLLNPLIYNNEGLHAATLNPKDYISIWYCLLMLTIFSIIFGYMGIKRTKKRLNCI